MRVTVPARPAIAMVSESGETSWWCGPGPRRGRRGKRRTSARAPARLARCLAGHLGLDADLREEGRLEAMRAGSHEVADALRPVRLGPRCAPRTLERRSRALRRRPRGERGTPPPCPRNARRRSSLRRGLAHDVGDGRIRVALLGRRGCEAVDDLLALQALEGGSAPLGEGVIRGGRTHGYPVLYGTQP